MDKLIKFYYQLNFFLKKPTSSNIIWLFLDKLYGALLTLYIYSKIAIYFESKLFGVWNYIISFSTVIVALGAMGLDFIIVKRIKKNPLLSPNIITNAFLLRLIFGVIISIFVFAIYMLVGINIDKEYILTVFFIFSSQIVLISNTFIFWNEAHLVNKWTVLTRNVALTIAFILKLFAIQNQLSIEYFAAINLVEFSSFFLLIHLIPKNNFRMIFPLNFQKRIARPLIKEGIPLLLSAVTVTLYLKLDQLIIGYLLGNNEVGIYATASRLTEMLYLVPVVLSNVFFPRIIEKFKQGKEEATKNILNQLFGITIIITLAISITVSLFSKAIISYIFGEGYIRGADVLRIYAWSIVFMGLLTSSSKYLLVMNKSNIILKRGVIGLVSNIVLNFILIPKYGILGAAWATIFSYALASYFSNFFFKETRPLIKDQVLSIYSLFKNNH